eukprot:7577316-Pyramimonas_sp.AAC.1
MHNSCRTHARTNKRRQQHAHQWGDALVRSTTRHRFTKGAPGGGALPECASYLASMTGGLRMRA